MSEEENCKDKNFGSKNQHTDTHTHIPTHTPTHTHTQREQIGSIYFCLCWFVEQEKPGKKEHVFQYG